MRGRVYACLFTCLFGLGKRITLLLLARLAMLAAEVTHQWQALQAPVLGEEIPIFYFYFFVNCHRPSLAVMKIWSADAQFFAVMLVTFYFTVVVRFGMNKFNFHLFFYSWGFTCTHGD